MGFDFFSELEGLVRDLTAEDVDYALCGGLALAVYGVPRATVDIDLLVPADSLEDALRVAKARGFELEAARMTFADGRIRIHRVSKADPDTGDLVPLDYLVVTPYIEEIWEDRRKVEWEAGELWLVSRAGLIQLKRLRSSAQDLADIERLEAEDD